jgi:peroxiredoxin Q/BCP
MALLETGETVADFKLMDQEENEHSLSDLCEKLTLLYFYPRAMTPGCTTQACIIRDSSAEISKRGLTVIGISCDAPAKLKKFKEKEHLDFMLLSDPDHKVCSYFGVWGKKKMAGREYEGIYRSSFIIDKGRILASFPKVSPKTHLTEIFNWLDANPLSEH